MPFFGRGILTDVIENHGFHEIFSPPFALPCTSWHTCGRRGSFHEWTISFCPLPCPLVPCHQPVRGQVAYWKFSRCQFPQPRGDNIGIAILQPAYPVQEFLVRPLPRYVPLPMPPIAFVPPNLVRRIKERSSSHRHRTGTSRGMAWPALEKVDLVVHPVEIVDGCQAGPLRHRRKGRRPMIEWERFTGSGGAKTSNASGRRR